MGYTHYWIPKESTKEDFQKFSAACKKLHDSLPKTTDTAGGYSSDDPLEIRGGMGEGTPAFTPELVWFNGNAERDLDHETFVIDHTDNDSNFCKTARKPYDLLVVACLLAAVDILDYRFSSDGFTDYFDERNSVKIHECDDLLPALKYYNKVMGTNHTEDHLWKIHEEFYTRQ
jgi:hypothetical protein